MRSDLAFIFSQIAAKQGEEKKVNLSMVLTDKQRSDLHVAIADYLRKNGFETASRAVADETGIELGAGSDILEKKWTAVVRLQKRTMELEAQVKKLEEELKNTQPSASRRTRAEGSRLIPRAPHKMQLSRHRCPISRVVFHPVFSVLVTSSEDASIAVWDYESGQFERTLKGHTGAVNDVAFNSKGTALASASADLNVRLWDFDQTYECCKTLKGHEQNVSGVDWVHGDELLVSVSRDLSAKVWEVGSGYCLQTLRGHGDWVRRVVAHPAARSVATCSSDKTVRIWSLSTDGALSTGVLELYGHEHVIECVAWSNSRATTILAKHFAPTDASGVAGGLLGAGEGGASGVADASNDEDNQTTRSSAAQEAVAEGAPGAFLASGGRDKTIRVWHVASERCVLVLQGHDNWVRDLAFHPNGLFLLSCSDDRSIRVWDLAAGRAVKTIADAHGHFVSSLHINPEGSGVATGCVDHSVRFWECI
jgi:platelet-activating factor acetylhydrolase IB subunit alpha